MWAIDTRMLASHASHRLVSCHALVTCDPKSACQACCRLSIGVDLRFTSVAVNVKNVSYVHHHLFTSYSTQDNKKYSMMCYLASNKKLCVSESLQHVCS